MLGHVDHHYLLVAGYDVYGNLGHQLLSRLYMDFLRMEGESGFLLLLPKEARDRERDYWYRGADPELMEYLRAPEFEAEQEPKINYKTDNQKAELIGMLKHKLASALSGGGNLASIKDPAISQPLTQLNNMSGEHLQLFPEQSLVLLATPDGDKALSTASQPSPEVMKER